ncbi:transmembrane protein 220 [Protopterus annectens]|uniref:transmembrane protein 220 n=1 Tax=Protopterus annectens TaxID=7888 RepID=UPI001CF945DD|nr:transmembrane protein 220 [Protopterus annectens]
MDHVHGYEPVEGGGGGLGISLWQCHCWRFCNVFMGFFFALAAYVQINDPDAGVWMVAYSIPAILSLLTGINPQITENLLWKSTSKLHMIGCAVGAAYLGWSIRHHLSRDIIHEEEGRELFGLTIILIWLLLAYPSGK